MGLKKEDIVVDNKVYKLLQRQVNHEFENERLYTSMALWCEKNGYIETAKFFSGHSLEERKHGMAFINFMLKQKMSVETPYTTDIPRDFDSLKDVIVSSVRKENETTKMIEELHKEAVVNSPVVVTIAHQFLCEQVEEEQLFLSLLNLFKLCGDSKIDFEMEVGLLKSSSKYKIGEL